MSYTELKAYQITPDESFKIIRNCSGCNAKTVFQNTNCFRVNANGKKIDVWLIYQCVKCKHTCNLTIHDRRNPKAIRREDYEEFLCNSSELAQRYGTDVQLFSRNKAEIDWTGIRYSFRDEVGALLEEGLVLEKGNRLILKNCFMLKVRSDKVVSLLLSLPRQRIKEMEKSGDLTVSEDKSRHEIVVDIHRDIEVHISETV